jgi:hypothetical protein
MSAPTKVGDLVVWYSAFPRQEFGAHGWVSGRPHKPSREKVKHYRPVCGGGAAAGSLQATSGGVP